MQQVSHRTNVLRAYRQLLHLIKRLPPSQQGKALSQARTETATDRDIDNAIEASDKLKKLFARIGYLRTITPRRPGDAERLGSGHYVLRDGELVPSDLTPESRCLHHQCSVYAKTHTKNLGSAYGIFRMQHVRRVPA